MTPPPGFAHRMYLITRSISAFSCYVRRHKLGRVVLQSGVVTEREPHTVRGPDVSSWSNERLPLDETPSGYPDVPAELCVRGVVAEGRSGEDRTKSKGIF